MTTDSITVVLDYQSVLTRADVRLSNVVVLRVKREGVGYNLRASVLGNREVNYLPGPGQLQFETAGTMPLDALAERVTVVFKY